MLEKGTTNGGISLTDLDDFLAASKRSAVLVVSFAVGYKTQEVATVICVSLFRNSKTEVIGLRYCKEDQTLLVVASVQVINCVKCN